MSDLDRIVNVNISRQTVTPSIASFSGILIAAEFLRTAATSRNWGATERVRQYGDLPDLAADGYSTSSFVYKAAAAIFSQDPAPDRIYVGRKKIGGDGTETWSDALGAMLLANAGWYGVVVSIRDQAYQEEVATWIEANKKLCCLVSGDDEIYEENYSASAEKSTVTLSAALVTQDTLNITINGHAFNQLYATSSDSTVNAIISAINADANMIAAGITAETDETSSIRDILIYGPGLTVTCSVAHGGSGTATATHTEDTANDIMSWLKSHSIERTCCFYDPVANTANDLCMDAAFMGVMFTADPPGSVAGAFKQLAGQGVYVLTPAQITAIESKNGNYYTAIADIACTQFGKMGSGEWFDVMHGIDWLIAQIQNQVITPLINLPKVPYTDDGIQIIVAGLKYALQMGVDGTLLASFSVTYPKAADVSSSVKGTRVLPNVKFKAPLAGAINKTEIDGTVTY